MKVSGSRTGSTPGSGSVWYKIIKDADLWNQKGNYWYRYLAGTSGFFFFLFGDDLSLFFVGGRPTGPFTLNMWLTRRVESFLKVLDNHNRCQLNVFFKQYSAEVFWENLNLSFCWLYEDTYGSYHTKPPTGYWNNFHETEFYNIWWPMPLFFTFISQIPWYETSTFIYSNFAWGLHGGVDVKWSGGVLVLVLHWHDCGIVLKSAWNWAILPNGDWQCGH